MIDLQTNQVIYPSIDIIPHLKEIHETYKNETYKNDNEQYNRAKIVENTYFESIKSKLLL